MSSVSMNLTKFEKFERALRKAPAIMQEEVITATKLTGEHVRAEAVDNINRISPYSPVNSGQMRASLTVGDHVATPAEIRVPVSVGVAHGVVVEKGRKPGKFPPVSVMRKWVRRKGIASGKDADRVAFMIGRKIKEEGIKEKPFLEPAVSSDTTNKRFLQQLSDAVNRAFSRVFSASV